ncbi:hypothetical protein [Bacillus sp. 165]|uniref:hypothetical protein n=1 Tax=Bacillus sp. 165 TaxID=1529117 RepID=UPI001ADB753A|nr:hypothetical protein [Bacillus sp. 165]MBO9130899.1 hypothetical protein [Bacillus sp. 165]
MPRIRPNFMDSPYFIDEPGNWHLVSGAPEEVQEEFEAYVRSMMIVDEPGTINGIHIQYP